MAYPIRIPKVSTYRVLIDSLMKPRLTKGCRNIATYNYTLATWNHPLWKMPESLENTMMETRLKSWGKVSISDGVSDKDSSDFYLQSSYGFPSGAEAN